MQVDPTLLREGIRLGEDSALEFKEVRFRGRKVAAPDRDDLADELVAFANARRGGRLVLGVTDKDRTPQPLEPWQLDAVVDLVREICNDSVKPPMDVEVYRVPNPPPATGGILLVAIPAGDAVHQSPHGYFRRRVDAKYRMLPDEVRRLLQSRGQSDTSGPDTRIVRGTGFNSLRRELWQQYASSRSNERPVTTLGKLKFLKPDGEGVLRATVGGVLLACEAPREWLPNAYIQAVCYGGAEIDGNRQLDAQDIDGPLDRQIRDAMRFVIRNRRVAARKDPARTDVPQYSERAVFEAVVNAVVHRDYAVSGSHIRLFMFDNRLELYSPGGLCNSMTTDDLRTSQFTRNELLASRLGQCPVGDAPGSGGRQYFIERRGEGIAVIEDETFALAGEKPTFDLIGERELRIVLPAASPPLPDGIAARIEIRNEDTREPLPNVHVLLLYPNKTWLEARTNSFGQADFELHARLPMTVLCAAPGFAACVARDYLPEQPLGLTMRPTASRGSLIIAHRTGHLPGIRGRLNPILDDLDRMYLYADNVAIDGGLPQPVHFKLNDPVRLTDSLGAEATLWFREMVGGSCVFDYRHDDFRDGSGAERR